MIHFTVIGTPRGAPRPRRAMYGKGVYVPDTAKPFEDAIRLAALPHRPPALLSSPIHLSLSFRIQRPKTHFNKKGEIKPNAPVWCPRKPDLDNAIKVVLDVLTECQFWVDDAEVTHLNATKRWAGGMNLPGVFIEIGEQ